MTAEANPRTDRGTWVRVLVRGAVLTVVLLGLVAFSVLLAKVTLTPSPASADLVTANLRPGRSLRQYAEDYTFLAACKQAGGNLLLGVPFGLLLPFFVPRRLRMIRTTLLTAVAMSVVELIQGALVEGRAFDIDDVILNTAGALLGYFVLGRRISHRYYTYTDDTGSPGPSAEKPEAEPKRAPGPAGRAKAALTKTAPTKAARAKAAPTKTVRAKTARTKAARTKTGQRDRPKPAATAPAKKRGVRTGRTDGAASGGRRATGSGTVRSLLDRLRGR
ncbi:VanZ family protein [Streptomyces anulatus]|uniref:VanZ family protein n=1 Tax=Streptomyces anulatus TaxID=1892 RepID=A0ABZ1ZVW7_STRAQ|nr:VanZ family protein [Streptomyces anulatus]WSU26994.1 VanZ family protein [Streptomyces anulatus]